jgi:hypothetical protein
MMTIFTIDTNAGPIVTRDFADLDQCKSWTISMVPIARRRGYTVTWERVHKWHVARIHNTKGKIVHRLAVMEGRMKTTSVSR